METVLVPYDMIADLENDFATKDGFAAYDDPPTNIPPEPPPTTTPTDISYNTVEKVSTFIQQSPHILQSTVDPTKLRQFFAFLPTEVVSRTLQKTTQYARVRMTDSFKRFYKTPFPALNVARRSEDLLTDIIYSDFPAIDDGLTCATIYSGRLSHVLDVYGMKSESQFVNTLEDIIRERGAPTRLLSDSAMVLRSSRVKDILRALYIG